MNKINKKTVLVAVGIAATFGMGMLVATLTVAPHPPAPVAPTPPPAAATPPVAPTAAPEQLAQVIPVVTSEPEPGVPFEEPDPPRTEPLAPEPPAPVAVLPPALVAPPVAPPPGGAPAWVKNAIPARLHGDQPVIAIVIDDLGLDRKRSARTVKLPAPLTLAWLPYAQDLRGQTHAAHEAGHELLLHMPMEPSGHADPGPDALLVHLSGGEIQRRFAQALASFDGYVGVNNHMGSRFTADRAVLAPVLAEARRRGLLWLDSRTTPSNVAASLAGEMKIPYAGRDIFLDNVETLAAVRAQLAKTEETARHHGAAIAIGHPHDATLEALASWLPEVQKRGFVLVPVSAVVRARCACG